MSSEGKLFAPKPIRRSVNLPALKYSKSIGCPVINPKIELFSNSKFSEFTNKTPKMASNAFLPDDDSVKNSENEVPNKFDFVSYEEFENEINADISKQSATSEILAILSNSKKTKFDYEILNTNKNSSQNNSNNNNFVINDNKNKFQTNYKNNEFSVQNSDKNSPLKKKFKLSLDKENAINPNAFTAEFSNVKNNFLINPQNFCSSNAYNANPSAVSSSFLKVKKESDMDNLEKILSCIDIAEKENDSNIENSNTNKNLFSNVQQPKINLINDLNNKDQNAKRPFSLFEDEKASVSCKNKYLNTESNLFEEKNNLNFQYTKNILYFLDENFFLEFEKENSHESFNLASSLDNSFGKYDNISSQLRKTTSNPIPIRCTNPFEKNLSAKGCSKISKFLAEEMENNSIHLKSEHLRHFKSKPDFIENFLFSEPQTLKVRK